MEMMLGGPGVIVQIDESLFRYKPKVELLYMIPIIICCNQIYFIFQNRGPPRSQIWVFGMVDVSHIPALGYMQTIPQWDARTLLPIIQQHVRPGTIVWSDEWQAYNRVQQLNPVAQHQTVNHSITFVDPVTGVHTQNAESFWN